MDQGGKNALKKSLNVNEQSNYQTSIHSIELNFQLFAIRLRWQIGTENISLGLKRSRVALDLWLAFPHYSALVCA